MSAFGHQIGERGARRGGQRPDLAEQLRVCLRGVALLYLEREHLRVQPGGHRQVVQVCRDAVMRQLRARGQGSQRDSLGARQGDSSQDLTL